MVKAAKKNIRGRPRYGGFFVDPDFSGYENAVGTCSRCGETLIVNRATDLDNTYPSSGQKFRCFRCGRQIRLGGDIANHPVDQIADDARRPLQRREYMQATLMVAQSLELALAMCVFHLLLGSVPRPKRIRPTSPFAVVLRELEEQLNRLTLGQLRGVLAALGAAGTAPASVADARAAIASLRSLIGAEPPPAVVAAISDSAVRDAVRELIAAKPFVQLRNNIAHHGLRPTKATAEHFWTVIPRLATQCLRAFGVMRGQLVMPPVSGGRRRAR